MEACQAHEPEPGDLSQVARELDPEFVPDPLDRMVMSVEYPAYRRNAANFNPLSSV